MKWPLKFGYMIAFFLCSPHLIAQNDNIISYNEFTFYSKILSQQRNILVYLPASYDKHRKYPVVYVLDGNQHTLFTGAAIDELADAGAVPQMIVVGIPNIDRTKDLTPTYRSNVNGSNDPALKTSGGGNNFLDFITNELFHYIDSAYSTMPYRIFLGHSFGGLLVTHALFSSRNRFNSYVAIDPTLSWDNNYVINNVAQVSHTFTNNLYISSAMDPALSVDPGNNGIQINALRKILDAKLVAGLSYKFENFRDETHGTIPVPSIIAGIKYLFEGFGFNNIYKDSNTTNLAIVLDHYTKFSKKHGVIFPPPENLMNDLGYYFLNEYKDYDNAITIFKLNNINFSFSYNTFDSLGEAYLIKGDEDNALKNYQQALKLNPQCENAKKMIRQLMNANGQ